MRGVLIILLCAIVLVPASGATEPPPPSREALLHRLNAIDSAPDLAWFRAVGQPLFELLASLAEDPAAPPRARDRALLALAWVDPQAARPLLSAVALDVTRRPQARLRATLGLANAGGDESRVALEALLGDAEATLREAALRGLVRLGPQGAAAVRRHQAGEREPWLRALCDRLLEVPEAPAVGGVPPAEEGGERVPGR
jgi:hypothetical protein